MSGVPPSGDNIASEFWPDAIAATKRVHPDFLFLAEVYWGLEERLQSLGFDFTYDKTLYDELLRRNPVAVQQHLLKAPAGFVEKSAHFLENHDDPRVASLLSLPEHRAAALLVLGLPGMRLLHQGQLSGARVKIPVQFAGCYVESSQAEVERMYEQLLTILPRTAVGRGNAAILEPREAWPGNFTAQDIVLIQWQAEPSAFDLVAVNLAPHPSQCRAKLRVERSTGGDWLMRNLLGAEQHCRSESDLQEGLFFDLPGHGAQLFHFEPVGADVRRL